MHQYRYYTQVFLAIVQLLSPQCIPPSMKKEIHDFMAAFLQKATYIALKKGEEEYEQVWATFLPYIRVLYIREPSNLASIKLATQMHHLSLQTILLSLQNMLSCDYHRKVLFKEKLEDYVTCLPAHVPPSLKGQARELVQIIASGLQLQPPTLFNLTKAKLAKMHFGLQDLMNMTVGEIVNAKTVKLQDSM